MSNANPASNAMSSADTPVVPEVLRRLATVLTETILAAVLARAVRRAHRELAALDDRTLADIGLDRAAIGDLAATDLWEFRNSPAQFPWHRLHTSA